MFRKEPVDVTGLEAQPLVVPSHVPREVPFVVGLGHISIEIGIAIGIVIGIAIDIAIDVVTRGYCFERHHLAGTEKSFR